MRRLARISRMSLQLNRHSKMKFILLVILVSVGVLVFLAVTELSRSSTEGLDRALDSDLGAAGTYKVEMQSSLGLTLDELIPLVQAGVKSVETKPMRVVEVLPDVRTECPPSAKGSVRTYVLRDAKGRALPLSSSFKGPAQEHLCLAGLAVDRTAFRALTRAEERVLGDGGLIANPAFEHLIRLTSAGSAKYVFIVTTGGSQDMSSTITASVSPFLAEAEARSSMAPGTALVVSRVDPQSAVRSASDGIKLVYLLIGWGVLLIGGLGVLVAELIVLRDRTWFFGLARAVGARKSDIALLVLADIVLVLLAGFLSAFAIVVASQPAIESFGRTAFATHLSLLRAGTWPQLIAGAALMLTVGGAYPAWRATKLDPLEVLERR
jgi:predicted lysophospholipase L1 biosynthesis ABC-type transport system permease subunit